MASESESGPRVTGRHAAPRLTVRGRLRLPVGRAIALTAVPTALLMGTIAPKFALAADATSSSAAATSHDHATDAAAAPTGSNCTKTSISSLIAGTTKTGTTKTGADTGASSTAASTTTGGRSTGGRSSGTAPTKSSAGSTAPSTAPSSATPSQVPSHAPSAVPAAGPTSAPASGPTGNPLGEGVGTILNGLGQLLGLDAEPARPAASPTPSAAATPTTRHADTTTPVSAVPSASATRSAPAATATPSTGATRSTVPAAAPSTVGTPAATSPTTSTTSAEANRACDVSRMAAPLDTSMPVGEMPTVPWTLKSSSLELINTQFWGVVTVPTAAGDVRVLKFTAQEVNIGDLDMSTQQIGQELHVQGGPGTTSTMRGGTVTMYVTSLSGTLAEAEGIPLAWLGVNLTLTPDTLPQWLYDLIGSVPIPLTLTLNNAVATQTGQFGGNLTIPGMHLYYTPLS
ncbi:hypothetical protein [Streptacidiphilus albus]|uniref:hypothetical protein n=1 Tax=Streptacidiphilus albus TaxID=105425 RepID=UPI00054B990F|nr:hypothetical protein [Streptacidiphilus albus]